MIMKSNAFRLLDSSLVYRSIVISTLPVICVRNGLNRVDLNSFITLVFTEKERVIYHLLATMKSHTITLISLATW